MGRKFQQNCSIEGNRRFFHFWQKFENSKWPPFWGEEIFRKLSIVHCLNTLWVENFNKIALSRTVKEIEENLCFCTFWQKFKMAAIFGERKCFLKIAKSSLLRHPVGRKFCLKSLYLAWLRRQKQTCAFFATIQNGCHFWRGKFF